MKIAITFSEVPETKTSLVVQTEIRTADSITYHASCHQKDYLVKVFSKTDYGKECYVKERSVQHLNHPNIIRYIPTISNLPNEEYHLVTEHAKNGRFSDILKIGPLKTEALVRTYFHQLIEGIEYIHSQGFLHLDLKLENLMIDSDYMLKITGFDKCQTNSNTGCVTSLQNLCGESSVDNKRKLQAIDIFSAGIILFAFQTGKLPFILSKNQKDPRTKNLKSYSYFSKHNKEFWQNISKGFFKKIKPSIAFIELVNGMLRPNPEDRLGIEDIKKSEWYRGPIIKNNDLEYIMETICRKVNSKTNSLWSVCLFFFAESST